MNNSIRIIGFAVCPACQLVGHDADSCRANQLSDGRVKCFNCGSFIAPFDASAATVRQMPYQLKTLVALLLREHDGRVPLLRLAGASFGPDGSSSQAAFACAQGNEGVILNGGNLQFSAGEYSFGKLSVRFMADELADVPAEFTCPRNYEPDVETRQLLQDLQTRNCPAALVSAIGRLVSVGFTVRHTDLSGAMHRVLLHCGGNFDRISVPKGIMVEATYLV
jgi:hypothetical protein